MIGKVNSMGIVGTDAYTVKVEADLGGGLPAFDIVGLPDASVKEARNRTNSAARNSGLDFPQTRITVNLAPADIRKEGSLYDLPILISILKTSHQFHHSIDDCAFIGELSLSGELRPVSGILPMTLEAKNKGFGRIFVPAGNGAEAAIVQGITVYPVETLRGLLDHFAGKHPIQPAVPIPPTHSHYFTATDFSAIKGQTQAKRALEIAAAGNHNVLLIGPPGSGKSLMAKSISSILPDMTFNESIETTKIHSIAGKLRQHGELITDRPFRSPHHTVSSAALSGGGAIPKPGELSLAHNGVLFLDELPEFPKIAMEVLRQPIEDATVTVSRVSGSVTFPCDVLLVCAMNPCPCGNYSHPEKKCTCSPQAVSKYLNRVSGPLLDRLDLHIDVPPVSFTELRSDHTSESSSEIRNRVNKARAVQLERLQQDGLYHNARMNPEHMQKYCRLSDRASVLLKNAFDKLMLSARAYDKIRKVSRTIADLDGCEIIDAVHISEAIQYRSLDRKYWS